MSRHIADHPSPEDAGLRLKHFLRLAREEERHPAARALHVRRPSPPAEGRLKPVLAMLHDPEQRDL
jgi:hypothetical protein